MLHLHCCPHKGHHIIQWIWITTGKDMKMVDAQRTHPLLLCCEVGGADGCMWHIGVSPPVRWQRVQR